MYEMNVHPRDVVLKICLYVFADFWIGLPSMKLNVLFLVENNEEIRVLKSPIIALGTIIRGDKMEMRGVDISPAINRGKKEGLLFRRVN